VANGYTAFVREFPLAWNGQTYLDDFAFVRQPTTLERNGRRRHDVPVGYERDDEKWSVPVSRRHQAPKSWIKELDGVVRRCDARRGR